jgi:hypothetical protein
MKDRSPSFNERRIKNDYNERLTGDLPKFLGLIFQTLFIWFAARFPFFADKPVSNKHNPSVDNADAFVTQAAGVISGLFGYLVARGLIASNHIKYPHKKSLNPFYRSYKTLSIFFQMIGSVALIPVFFVSKFSQRLDMGFSSAFVGIFGVFATSGMLWAQRYFKCCQPDDNRTLFKIGPDGWAKFVRTALYWGMCIGGVFGYWFFIHGGYFNNLNTAVMYTGAWGGIVCSVLSFIAIPTFNYFFKDKNNKPLLGFYAQDDEGKMRERNRYRDNYFRVGITIGVAIGAAALFIGGTLYGFPTEDMLGYVALGGSAGGAIGGVCSSLLGSTITAWVKRDNTANPWDFILANTATLFGYLGISLGTLAGLFIPFPGGALGGMALGSIVGKAAGNILGLAIGSCWNSSREEEETEQGPWTQRMLLAANRYAVIGAALGFTMGIGIYFLYPVVFVCPELSLITVLGASVSIGTSAFAFLGGVTNAYNATPSEKKVLEDARSPGKGVRDIHQLMPGSTPTVTVPISRVKEPSPYSNGIHQVPHVPNHGRISPKITYQCS